LEINYEKFVELEDMLKYHKSLKKKELQVRDQKNCIQDFIQLLYSAKETLDKIDIKPSPSFQEVDSFLNMEELSENMYVAQNYNFPPIKLPS
jgi:hypothetical protein